MTPLKDRLKSLGISRKEFSETIGVNYRTVHRWTSGNIPPYVDCLLRAWEKLHSCGIAFRDRSINIQISKRGRIEEILPNEIKRRIFKGIKI